MTDIAERRLVARAGADVHWFYVVMAVVCAVFAFAGFAPSYWAPLAAGAFHAAPIVHLHGTIFFGWTLLLIVQTTVAANGRMTLHREFGVLGVSLATAMLFSGTLVAIHSLNSGIAAGAGDAARAFSIVPFTGILMFAVLFAIAVVNVRRPDVHKRLVLLATISILQAAVGRWFFWLLAPRGASGPPPVAVTIGPGLVVDLLIMTAIVYDWKTRGRPHPIYLIGGASVVAIQFLRVPISTTPVWLATADWLAALAA